MTQHANPEAIGRRFRMAEVLAKELQTVLAISDDFYGFRVYQKRTPGVIIQNGEILANKSLSKPHYTLPTYDLIALYADGSMKTFLAGSIDAEELLAQGATDTWCFGPVLLSEGEIGQQVLEDRFEYINPRQTIGMIEPNHYLIMTIEGRNKRSHGVGLVWTAERMRELGCTEALNLDGGNSVKLVFMGELVNSDRHYNEKNDRSVTSLITLGTFPFDQLPQEEASTP
jgi:exopolysaccharide biosynthesis protein